MNKKIKLAVLSFLLYFALEFVTNLVVEVATGTPLYTNLITPIAGGKTSIISPLLFTFFVLLLFDSFAPAYKTVRGSVNRHVFVGIVMAMLGPFYEWISGVVIKLATGSVISTYHVLPIMEGYTSWSSPIFFFLAGLFFVEVCVRTNLLEK